MKSGFRRLFNLALVVWILSAPAFGLPTKERPIPPGGGPTVIECLIGVTDVDAISDAEQNFTVRLYSLIRWMDPREIHDGPDTIHKSLDEVWNPDISYLNRQRIWESTGQQVSVSPEGEVTLRHRLWGDFSQPLNLHDFPFDVQTFEIKLVSGGGWARDEVVMVQDPTIMSFVSDDYSVADWEIGNVRVWSGEYSVPGLSAVTSFSLQFTGDRLVHHYMIKILAPLFMIVCLSWVVFWIDPSEGGSQLGVAVTSFLTVIAYHVALSSRLPKIPYLTRFDVFVFAATILVFLAMIEVVITTGLANSNRINQARWTDRACRLIFPGLLAVSAVYAFVWH